MEVNVPLIEECLCDYAKLVANNAVMIIGIGPNLDSAVNRPYRTKKRFRGEDNNRFLYCRSCNIFISHKESRRSNLTVTTIIPQ